MILVIVAGFVISTCFAIVFQVRGANVFLAGVAGAVGAGLFFLGKPYLTSVFSAFIGSCAVTLLSEIFARWRKRPVTTFLPAGLIPIVRGSQIYEGVMNAFAGNRELAADLLFSALMDTVAMALGIILIASVTRRITMRKKRKP